MNYIKLFFRVTITVICLPFWTINMIMCAVILGVLAFFKWLENESPCPYLFEGYIQALSWPYTYIKGKKS